MVTWPCYCMKGLLSASTYAEFCHIVTIPHAPVKTILSIDCIEVFTFYLWSFFLHLTFEWVVGGVFLGPVSVCSSMAEQVLSWRGRMSCPRKWFIWIWRIFKLDVLYLRITKIHIFNLHKLYLEIIKIYIFNLHILYLETIKIHIFKSIFRFPISSLGSLNFSFSETLWGSIGKIYRRQWNINQTES